jgi:ATP phosphoribosyltransferase regulatory subunit
VQQYGLAEVRRRRAVESTLTAALRGWSYEEVILPMLDYEEVFERSVGHAGSGRMYRLIDPEGHVVGVRPDLTPLAAKLVATGLKRESLPIRVFYSGEVVRPQGPKTLGQGEFHQIGFEQVGGDRGPADLEVVVVALEALRASGLRSYRMLLTHSGILPALVHGARLEPQAAAELERSIDRHRAHALEEVLASAGVAAPLRRAFRALMRRLGRPEDLAVLGRQAGPAVERYLLELRRLWEDLQDLGFGNRVGVDLTQVGGFGYYTGVRFRAYAEGVGFSIGGGGRYDNLLGQFGSPQPAVGFSFGLDRLLRALEATGDAPAPKSDPARAVRIGERRRCRAMLEALDLRRRGGRVRLC